LSDTGFLTGRATAVHATHLSEGDRDLLASSGAGACFCPTTERDLGDGIGPARELRDRGVSMSLGSDSNATIDLFEEARSLELNDRLRLERRGVHSPDELLRSASGAGLASLGWGVHEPLAVHSPADFVAVGYGGSGFDPIDGVGAFLFSAPRPSISDVIVAGKQVVRDGLSTSGQSGKSLHRLIRQLVSW
jgi:cytosine/adenosine deaminase-related metal-dependent hydrolase